jgi:hypothetical protein
MELRVPPNWPSLQWSAESSANWEHSDEHLLKFLYGLKKTRPYVERRETAADNYEHFQILQEARTGKTMILISYRFRHLTHAVHERRTYR